jgi:hypothetical protein
VSSRLLIEGGYSSNIERYNNLYAEGVEQPYGSARWLATARHYDSTFGRKWVAADTITGQYPDRYNAQGSASYITGTHSFKFGFQDSWGVFNHVNRRNADLYQNYLTVNGVLTPNTVTVYNTPVWSAERLDGNLGVYAQDVWTLNRTTVTAGLRWEYVDEQVTGQPRQVGRFVDIPAFDTFHPPTWKTWSPRVALVHDLFGNGKTAVRAGFNRFQSAATTTLASLYDPAAGNQINATATWNDKNRNDIAEGAKGCNFATDPACEINFAQVPANFGVISLASPDPDLKRPFVDQINVGTTHELFRGVSVSAEWFHNVAKNQIERNNVARPGVYNDDGTVTNANYRPVTVFSPLDGRAITVYDVVSAEANRAVRNVDSNDPRVKQTYNALEFNFNARLPHGARLSGGSASERFIAFTCPVAATNPNFLSFCDQTQSNIPWRTQFKIFGSVPLPWYGLQVAGSFQALPGYLVGTQALTQGGAGAPNFTNPSGLGSAWAVGPSTTYAVCPGNSASQGCVVGQRVIPGQLTSSINVPLVAPGTEMTPRVNQLDLSISKRITIRQFRIDPKIDIFNALNSDDYYSVRSTTFGPTAAAGVSSGSYMLPGSILQGRLLRIGAVVNW